MIQFLLLLIPRFYATDSITIEESTEATESFKIYYNEPAVLFEIPQAEDALLTGFQSGNFCSVRQQTVQTETQQFTIIQDKDFKEFEFEDDTPLNFRQFTGMIHVNDGMLAITSDSVAYLLKFNYDKVLEKSGFKIYGNGDNFAEVVWKANFQEIAPSLIAKTEIPLLVYAQKANFAFVIYSDSAQYFSIAKMEENLQSMQVFTVANWRPRQQRGLTKEIDGLLFSSVGPDGLDIYIINEQVTFKQNVQFHDLGVHSQQLILKDFSIVKIESNQYTLYLLDENIGMVIVNLQVTNQNELIFTKLMAAETQTGGVALDTRNGKNVFAAFSQFGEFFYIEYLVDLTIKKCEIITKQISHYRIIDVDATEEFAIISGLNHHQIVYQNGYDELSPHKEKIIFTQIGMRDFEFFKYTTSEQELEDAVKDDYQYDDFFFGVTATNAFLTTFKFVPAKVICFSDSQNYNEKPQYYNLQYNSSISENEVIVRNKVNRTTKNFSVTVVKTFLFEDRMTAVYVIFSLIGSVIFLSSGVVCYWWKNFSYQQEKLDAQIQEIKIRATNQSSNQLKLDESITKPKSIEL